MKKTRFGVKKYKKKLVDKELYKKWCTAYPEYANTSYDTFKASVNKLLIKYAECSVDNPHGVRLPFYNGDIALKYVQLRPNNFKSSLEAGKEVKFLNFATMRKAAKVTWVISYARKFNKWIKFLGFTPHTSLVKRANKKILENPGKYKNSDVK